MTKDIYTVFDNYRGGQETKIGAPEFLKFYKELHKISPRYDGLDTIWSFDCPAPEIKGGWFFCTFQEYNNTVYITVGHRHSFQFDLKKKVFRDIYLDHKIVQNTLDLTLKICRKQIDLINKDFVKYEAKRLTSMPDKFRTGIIVRKLVWELIPDLVRPEKELTKEEISLMPQIFSEQRFRSSISGDYEEMRTDLYFKYCKVAYEAALQVKDRNSYFKIDKKLSGREYYKKLADGRCGNLLEIDGDSPQEFEKWLKESRGDHPWEILRGGNTTHIDLGVTQERYDNKWSIFLNALSIGRMTETCKIAVALTKAKLPFKWYNWESIKLRLEGNDQIGIMPEYSSLHRGWQSFPEHLHVYDVLHLHDFEKKQTLAKKLIQWLPTEDFIIAPPNISRIDKYTAENSVREIKKRFSDSD
jgi:hypothetical protein